MTDPAPIVVGVVHGQDPAEQRALASVISDLSGAPVILAHVSPGESAALHATATTEGAELLVVGASDGADRVVHGAPCPVAVAPAGYRPSAAGLRRVGAAFVDTPEGVAALEGAAALSARAGAALETITIVHWFDPTGVLTPPHELIERARAEAVTRAEQATRRALGPLAADVESYPVVIAGGPAAELVAYSQGLDLLVCGSRGRGPVRSVVLGSVSRVLAHRARCPVMFVPRGSARTLGRLLPGAVVQAKAGAWSSS